MQIVLLTESLSISFFEGEKVEEDTVAQMYFYIGRRLFEKNPQLLIENPDQLKISQHSEDFRAPEEIAAGWYIESNVDSVGKFSSLKKLLTLFGMEDDLLIKYAPGSSLGTNVARFSVRRRFWKQLLPQITGTALFSQGTASQYNWLTVGAGIGGIHYAMGISKSYARIELYINTSTREKNKSFFDRLFKNKAVIETVFGGTLVWERLSDKKASRIKTEREGVNLYNEADWEKMTAFLVDQLPKFEAALQPFVIRLKS